METLSQIKNRRGNNTNNDGPKNPWYRFAKGQDGRIDIKQPNLRFRFLTVLDEIPMSRSHWDNDIKKPVRCNKTINPGKDGRIWLNGNCEYCDKRKEFKEAFVATDKQKFCPKDWDMSCTLVAPVAILNDDDTQSFRLLALNAKDYLYSVAKGLHKTLDDFTEMKASARKPTSLTDYWWELSPQFKLMSDDLLTEEESTAEVEGYLDENGNPFDLMQASPFDYKEALKLRSELEGVDNQTQDYPEDEEEETPPEPVKETKKTPAKKTKKEEVTGLYDDPDNAPFGDD